ncbi:unnamed protein product [Zymoseptoria tritici ST99CH_3D7]|uniref:Endonuclease III homolog n=1 Tax=Zymoseptoria tritici (strain ST99CH_3D7) TaxID=1276538 RepID=A0A1X7RFI5_ZYMT9|nr:unnamed protein product [Zymoseptoria tritici ST99CH_3D7]
MRAARITRDTARVAKKPSPPPKTSRPRRSLRAFAYSDDETNEDSPTPSEAASDFSSPPSSPDEAYPEPESTPASSKKRKHESIQPASTRKSPRKAPKKETPTKPIKHEYDPNVKIHPPPDWETIWSHIATMRSLNPAPVDSMGCENLAEETRSPLDRRLQTLVALMLSSQTKDPVTAAAMKNLQDNLEGGFNLEGLLNVEPDVLNNLIAKVGFHNNKTKYIKATAELLRDKWNGDIPETIEGLVSLPGVGPKMAYLTMSSAWGRDEGIGVDVHVHRISNLLGWHKTNTPEQTRAALESWLPKDRWHSINHLLVGFGQMICLPVGRRCGDCDLNTHNLCPSAVSSSPRKKHIVKKEIDLKVGTGEVVKTEKVVVDQDDVETTVEIKSEEIGNVALNGIPDIEDIGRSA